MNASTKNSLLVITQKVDVNDDNLGFFLRWLGKLAERKGLDELHVICLSEGKHENLPESVKVHSLGKDKGYSKIRQFLSLQKFLFEYLPHVDGIFVHMCPIYAIASFPLAKVFRKKMVLWFSHKSVNWKLKLAAKCVDKILTASEKSCRLKDRKKIEVVGHGVDIEIFKPGATRSKNGFEILSVGRISPIKDQAVLIEAVDILINRNGRKDIRVKFIGSPLEDEEKEYFQYLKSLVKKRGLENYVEFLGGVPDFKLPAYYQNADLNVNLSRTGSLDKVVLEAMASGTLVLTCNEAYRDILEDKYLFKEGEPEDLARKIVFLAGAPKDPGLRKIVQKNHNLGNLIDKIIQQFYA